MERSNKGDHSRKSEYADGEKPLKKARYVWEVKGKHHLKQPSNNSANASTSKENTQNGVNSEDNQKQDSISSSVTPTKNCCLKTFLDKTEDIMDRDSSDEDDSQKLPLESSLENEIPVTLVSAQPKNQDYYLRKWQARQIARGFVDNTINSMLETWGELVPTRIDTTDFVENCENDGQVEDDAILMAIQSHGLQSGWKSSPISEPNSSVSNSTTNSNCSSNFTTTVCSKIGSDSIILEKNSNIQESTCDNYENIQKEHENESSVASTSSSMSVDTVSSVSNPYDEDIGDEMNFLNAAVSVAIQKKGLTYG
ncbi:uncharacterized protein LOC115888327 [Sitophilus oryzae]|uniref:Uncharacterized protein LOC115888327 n=1 Tax=Sitophilus oryzae TaxID=7048 RepID=A0A6J2YKR9_SITOR|nr:uncharacterized protein LOC115888327 [Sitophilus oryzae]